MNRLSLPALSLSLLLAAGWPESALASYGNIPKNTHINSEVMRIDEAKFLGTRIDADYLLHDANGNRFTLGDMLGKPFLLVLSYYSCDGACPTLNRNLQETLAGVKRWQLGRDYRVLTLSFDRHDSPESLHMFMQHSEFGSNTPDGWRMALFEQPADIERLTESMGYKYFWSPRDAMFLHPSVYILLSPDGRVTRYLYGASIGWADMELSITKAYGNELTPANAINFMLAACYSYNYKEGKYSINYPLFIALGSLLMGLAMVATGVMIMKKRRGRECI